MYDRLTGGTTMIISSSGTTVPGSPASPEYLKASVYLPPAFVAHHTDLHNHIIDIVQQYIETVGVRTVTMWTQRARHDLNYSLTQRGNPRQNTYFNAIPDPERNSAHYTFLGQSYRIIQDPSSISVRAPSPEGSFDSYDFGEDLDAVELQNLDLQETNGELHDQINRLQHKITDLEQQVNLGNVSLPACCRRAQDQIMLLEGQLERFFTERTTVMSTPASTPARAHVTPAPLRYGQMTPRVQSARPQTPGYHSPGPHTPDTPSRYHGPGQRHGARKVREE
jgi:hypothetical protein